MCGIYGRVARDANAPPLGGDDGAALAQMDAALAHRGPDDSGTLLDGPCAIGMRRLSIIDLAGGHQPIPGCERAAWVVMNGEIYNHRALRRELAARGHRFTSGSDGEVIVHLYEELGERLLDRLRGMFACAIWDRRRRSLLLARDRLGIKPLYFAETAAGLLFASELKGLLAHPQVARALDPAALSHYLTFGTAPPDRGFVAGVRKLEPGCLLEYAGGSATVRRWWSPPAPAPAARAPSLDQAVAELQPLLADAVRSHLESDVEVGAFLSGGVDSATVVALMAEAGRTPRTFSIGFGEADFDELRWARTIAARFGTRHEEQVVRPDAWSLLDRLVPLLDEPMADVSALPTFLVSRLAAAKVKVVLSGDGGDEVFGGYDHYPQALAEARRLDRLPTSARRALGAVAALLPRSALGKRWLRHASLPPRLRFLDGESLFDRQARAELVAPPLAALLARAPDPLEARARLLERAPGDLLERLMRLDLLTYLPDDILTKVDRMSMAWSLEVRPPLLDTPLVEAVLRLPGCYKVRGRARKILLKRAMAGRLPPEILARRKRGFGVPIRHWMRGPLAEPVRAVLTDGRTRSRGLFQPRAVEALLAEHLSGRRDQSLALWSLLVLELWQRAVIDPPASARERPTPIREAQHG
jgi:asparagine synthase (glutamine-hydrolysing)